jgi:hypothetical protein
MNTRLIQQIDIWSPGGQRNVDKLSLTNFYGYKFDDGVGYVDYTLIGIQGEVYYSGNVEVPSNIIQQWGADDDIIWDYVATTLGLILVK